MKKVMVILALLVSVLIMGCQNDVEESDGENAYSYEDEYSYETVRNYEGGDVNELIIGCRGIKMSTGLALYIGWQIMKFSK